MSAANPLSDEDLVEARAAVSEGRPFMVWFTSAAVGVPAGASAKIVSVADQAEGDFIQVRPAGSRDTMFCSPNELTRTRPARKRAKRSVEPSAEPVAPPKTGLPKTASPKTAPPNAARPTAPRQEAPRPEKSPASPRSAGGGAAGRAADVTITLHSTPEGEWTVEVVIGKRRAVRPTPVQPGDVANVARSLPSVVAEAIESTLQAARQRQLDRVERLRAELESAERALQELG